MTKTLHFETIRDRLDGETPQTDALAAAYVEFDHRLDTLGAAGVRDVLADWDVLRRRLESWSAMVHLRFAQDTTDAQAKARREYADRLAPVITGHDVALKRRLLERHEDQLEPHVAALWRTDITTFNPAIAADLEEESRLVARHTEILASARLHIGGREVNLAGLAPFAENLDRELRHEAERQRWDFFASHGDELDSIYDRLVRLRHEMARKLGFADYTELGYRRMRRVDYAPGDVARFREQVRQHVVPLVSALMEQRRSENGWPSLHAWDESLIDPRGNPTPDGDHDTLIERARTMFDRLDPGMGAFYAIMVDGGFLDLRNRPGKAGGGFCTGFPTDGVPFIFANFNGTHHDINVFTHEMGHAFQNWESRFLPGIDVLWPTMEAAEINSMGLEFLTYPQIGLLVGEDNAARFRRMHLIGSLTFLPYGVCVDHFQHEVYANPTMSPAERHALWHRLERTYMPWRDWGDLGYPAMGGRWQAQHHIYGHPFYYIDYALALCCAMQYWLWDRRDHAAAMASYVGLAALGGSRPFTELVRHAQLASPFGESALVEVVDEAARTLELAPHA